MEPIKILQINAYYETGSTGNIVKLLEKAGIDNGYEMYSIYWLLRKNSSSQNVYYLGKEKNRFKILKMAEWIFLGGRISYNKILTKKIIDKIKDINPDIIHLHNLHGDFEYGTIDIKMLFEFLVTFNKKVIWTVHDCWPFTGRCYHFSYKNCDKWKTGCGNCPQRMWDREGIFYDFSRSNWRIKKDLYSKMKNFTIVGVSDWLTNVIKKSILKNHETITIYNGIDTEIFKPTDYLETKYDILCVGWDRRKGYNSYFKLANILNKNEKIAVVGKRPFFRRYKPLPSNIIEIERAHSSEEMARIYSSSKIYFNASPAETFGLTTVECLSCGKPVVAFDNTATTEIINTVEGNIGLAANNDIEGVKKIIEHFKNRGIESELFHDKCVKLFDKKVMTEKYIQLYRRVCEANK